MVRVKDKTAEFVFYRPGAKQVHLVGDFNNWQQGQLPMEQVAEGYWTARIPLSNGKYKFRYHADGQWYSDYAAFGLEAGPLGLDSVVRI